MILIDTLKMILIDTLCMIFIDTHTTILYRQPDHDNPYSTLRGKP